MTYNVAYGLWLYYKCTEKDLSIILLDFSISKKLFVFRIILLQRVFLDI